MTTLSRNLLVIALPVAQAETMRRLGYASSNFISLAGPERLNIINNGGYPADHPETRNLMNRFSADGGATHTHYLGKLSLTDAWWARIQARIPFLPASLRYARWYLGEDQVWTLVATNVAALQAHLGSTEIGPYDALQIVGLRSFPPGGNPR